MLKSTTRIFVFSALSLIASAQTPNSPASKATSDPASGFRTVDAHKGNHVRIAPGTDWSRYAAYRLAPATYQLSDARHVLTPWQVQEIKATVDSSLEKEFRQDREGYGAVLEVKPVITDVKKVIPLVNVVSFLAIQAPISFGGISMRYELFDAATGTLVGEIESKRSGRPWNIYPWDLLQDFERLGHSSILAKRNSCTVRKDLNHLHKSYKPQTQETIVASR